MRIRNTLTFSITVFSLLLICRPVNADPVGLNVTGNVVAAPCEVSSDSILKTIDLGNGSPIDVASLYTPGSTTPWVPFTLGVENCPAGTTTATINFHGEPDASNPDDMYKNVGGAGNIAIQLQGAGGEPFGDGKSFTGAISNNAYTYNLRARVYSQNGRVTSGSIAGVVTAEFTYQ